MTFSGIPEWAYSLVGAIALLAFALKIWYPFKKPFIPNGLILISGAEWLFMHALGLATGDLETKILLLKLKYIGIVMLPISWYLTAITYTYVKQHRRILPRLLIVIAPLLTLLLAFTNEYHHLFWTDINFHPEGAYKELSTTKGWGYWIFLIFAYSIVANSLVPYFKTIRHFANAFRIQSLLLSTGVGLPIIATIFDILDIKVLPSLELTPLASGISVLLIFTLNQSLRIGGIAPMRRDTIVDHMAESIIVLDAQSNILDLNTEATRFFQISRPKALRKKIYEITPPHYALNWDEMIQIDPEPKVASITHQNGDLQTFEISSTPIQLDSSNIRGVIISLHEITQLVNYKETISAALAEKEVLFQEIHHRIRNNLQVVASLLLLQMKEVDEPELKNIFIESRNRIQAMALIHDKLYQTSNLTRIPLGAYIKDLAILMVKSQPIGSKEIELEFNVDPIFVKIDTTISCGLILNELISNAIKHAFAERQLGLIQVEVKKCSEEMLRLCVRDDGVGLPDGFDINTGNTLGLQLISSLVIQLNGSLEVERSPGAKFQIDFPISIK